MIYLKKIVFLSLCVFLLTGCSVEYNISYLKGNLNESLVVTFNKDNNINGELFSGLVDQYYYDNYLLVDYRIDPGDMSESEVISTYKTYSESILNYNDKYGYFG